MTEEKRLSLGINVSILLILTIFGVLLSLPLRLLFDTNYSDQNREVEGDVSDPRGQRGREPAIPMDHRKLRRCPNLQYEDRLTSVFMSDYDRNCTYVRDDECDDDEDDDDDDSDSEEEEDSREDKDDEEVETYRSKRRIGREMKESAEEILKTRQMKSVTVAGHILVTMLLVSVIAALVEVLRIRFAREKDSSRAGTIISRRCSSNVNMDIPATRRPKPQDISRELIRSQKSFEIPGMHRSALRLFGARPPPLIRRSSFPISQAKKAVTSSLCGTPSKGLTRRQSAESDEEIKITTNTLHHRIRLIRRH